jgi:transposase
VVIFGANGDLTQRKLLPALYRLAYERLSTQRLRPFQKLAEMLLVHLDGILNYCRVPVRFGVVEAINGNIKALLRRGRGYTNLRYLLLKAQRLAALKTEFLVLRKAA